MISLVIYGSRDAHPTLDEIDRGVAELFLGRSFRLIELPEVSAFLSGLQINEVVCGMADGADLRGMAWARGRSIPVHEMPAIWRPDGKLDLAAGLKRNHAMAQRATHGLGYWRGWSSGTANMTTNMVVLGKPVKVVEWRKG